MAALVDVSLSSMSFFATFAAARILCACFSLGPMLLPDVRAIFSATVLSGGSLFLSGGSPSRSSPTVTSAAAKERDMPRSSAKTAPLLQRNVMETGRHATRFATSPRGVPLCTRSRFTATRRAFSSICKDEAGGCVARSRQECLSGSQECRSGSSSSKPSPPGSEKTISRSPRHSRQSRNDLDQRRGIANDTSKSTSNIESDGIVASKVVPSSTRACNG
mmetsp:Transcript_12597/g.24665  ORF Transcript_12597/g.24665 Transcript_12597/m.24665 type:complete len:219 (-) Transcript_12597:1084-1740(-)